MRINPKTIGHLALISLAAASISACAGKKPGPLAATNTLPPPSNMGSDTGPRASTSPGVTTSAAPAASTAPIPGSVQDFTVNVGDRVFFDYDQHEVRADAQPILDAQARWLSQYPQVAVRIEGNADERGTREYNFALGARRAASIRDYLASRGVAASRIETISYGKERPIDAGENEEAWARNRNGHTAITGGAR